MLFRITARSRATSSRTNSGEIAAAASAGAVGVTGVDCGAASRAGLASSRVLVADSNVSTPANAAAAITALMNFNITAPRSLAAPKIGDQNSSATNPQSATPTSSIAQSEGFSANSLPSLTTYANIAGARCSCPNTLATIGGNGCSTPITQRLNVTVVNELCGTCVTGANQKFPGRGGKLLSNMFRL